MNSTPAICSAFLKAANSTADLVDEGKFHAEVVAALTIGQAATRLVERRDDAFFGGDTLRSTLVKAVVHPDVRAGFDVFGSS
jgi:hypothetical protein